MTDLRDPRRLLEDDTASSDVERQLLAAARGDGPPRADVAKVWSALVPHVGLPGGPGPSGSGASSSAGGAAAGSGAALKAAGGKVAATGLAAAAKALALGAVAGVIVAGAGALATRSPSSSPDVTSNGVTSTRPASSVRLRPGAERSGQPVLANETLPPAVAPRVDEAESARLDAVPARPSLGGAEGLAAASPSSAPEGASAVAAFEPPATGSVASPPSSASPVPSGVTSAAPAGALLEARLVGVARAALRAGDPARAYGVLEEARVRFPNGVVREERDALTVEALAALGQGATARARAADFVRNYPSSPLSARVRTFAR